MNVCKGYDNLPKEERIQEIKDVNKYFALASFVIAGL